MYEIKSTKDYGMFKIPPDYRKAFGPSVRRLIWSISKENRLQYSPIIVDADFNIIDGVHRLEAAKAMNLEIFYCIHP